MPDERPSDARLNDVADAIVVGQGLAGTALAWSLLERGANLIIADAGRPGASSVAAGLVTPVTGQALRSAPDFCTDHALAATHYKGVESILGQRFWRERPALRIAQNQAQAQRLAGRLRDGAPGLRANATPPPAALRDVQGSALMPMAARLDVAAYVAGSADTFRRRGVLRDIRVEPRDVSIRSDGTVDACGLRSRHLVWCRGFYDRDNPWLPEAALSPAKGEIIDLSIAGWKESRVIHCGGHWLLAHDSDDLLSFGATYDHNDHSSEPTAVARASLLERATSLLTVPFEITGQRAGIRPVGARRQPVTGAHPVHKQIMMLNGLGSKGVLWAPREAALLSAMILGDTPVRTA